LHQPFDEAEGVLSEEEVSSSREELDVEKNITSHKSLLVYSTELELCVCDYFGWFLFGLMKLNISKKIYSV